MSKAMTLVVRKTSILITLLLAAGGIACMSSIASPFFTKFSVNELVQRNKTIGGLNCLPEGGGGGIGTGVGGIGKDGSRVHRNESFSCQISDADQFDEAKFIQTLRESIEKDLDACKAKIVGSDNSDSTKFYFEYTLEDIKGRVKISGTRSLGNYYTVDADLEEKSGDKSF
jgi:hypothetical protein